MKKMIIFASLLVCFAFSTFAKKGFEGRPITSNITMPTGFTLNRGEFLVGIGSIGFGISDNVQVGTNVFLFILQDYNANVKISFIKTEDKAFAVGFKVHSFDLEVDDEESGFTSLSPYAAFSTKVSRKTFLHLGGQYSYFSGPEDIEEAVAKATSTGSSVYLGIEHSYSHKTKFLAETGYDFTFEGFRIGGAVLWGWKTFRLKLGVNYFKPKGTDGFVFPVLSLRWRFDG
jgi:hypothetical protein